LLSDPLAMSGEGSGGGAGGNLAIDHVPWSLSNSLLPNMKNRSKIASLNRTAVYVSYGCVTNCSCSDFVPSQTFSTAISTVVLTFAQMRSLVLNT
jgi:hypothetical protein